MAPPPAFGLRREPPRGRRRAAGSESGGRRRAARAGRPRPRPRGDPARRSARSRLCPPGRTARCGGTTPSRCRSSGPGRATSRSGSSGCLKSANAESAAPRPNAPGGGETLPMAQILLSPTQTPVSGDVDASTAKPAHAEMAVCSSCDTYQRTLCARRRRRPLQADHRQTFPNSTILFRVTSHRVNSRRRFRNRLNVPTI